MGDRISSHKSKTLWIVLVVVLVVAIAAAIPILSSKTILNKNGSTSTSVGNGSTSTSNNSRTQTYGNSSSETLLVWNWLAGVWTTDKPANYSSLVTLVFQTGEKGVKYELVGNSYMAEAFDYSVINGTFRWGSTEQTTNGSGILQITGSGSPMQKVPFSVLGDALTLHYDGNDMTLMRDYGNMTSLQNRY